MYAQISHHLAHCQPTIRTVCHLESMWSWIFEYMMASLLVPWQTYFFGYEAAYWHTSVSEQGRSKPILLGTKWLRHSTAFTSIEKRLEFYKISVQYHAIRYNWWWLTLVQVTTWWRIGPKQSPERSINPVNIYINGPEELILWFTTTYYHYGSYNA